AIYPKPIPFFGTGKFPLQPLPGNDPGLILAGIGNIEVSHSGSFFRKNNSFGISSHAKAVCVYFCHKKRSSASEYSIVQFTFSVVNQIKTVIMFYPFLLGIII